MSFLSLWLSAQDYRYTTAIFDSVTMIGDVVYGNAPFLNSPYSDESNTTDSDLLLDIYQPVGDSLDLRPMIIFAHSGGFLTGNRQHDDMIAFCDSFARKGYVTATIDYRQGFYVITNVGLHSTRAAYRGLQDGRSAVRFMRANASVYGVDTNHIYLAGSSAGAFISLHSIYMDDPAEKPAEAGEGTYIDILPPFVFTAPDLGPYDIGDNLNFGGEPNAIISLWGAIQDSLLITVENDEPALLIHGTADGTVPFNRGNPFGVGLIPEVDGSNLINKRLENLGIQSQQTYFVNGADHEFYGTDNGMWENGTNGNAYWDTVLSRSSSFLWNFHKPQAAFDCDIVGPLIHFNDSSQGAIQWIWDFGDGKMDSVQNPIHHYDSGGTYQVQLYIENEISSWDTVSKSVTVCDAQVNSWVGPDSAYWYDSSSHWSLGMFPDNCHEVVIPTGKSIRMENDSSAQVYTLFVEFGGSLQVDSTAVLDVIARE